jgi:hypothetical protein
MSTSERERLKQLERENRELKRANEILRKASAYFAQAKLDRRQNLKWHIIANRRSQLMQPDSNKKVSGKVGPIHHTVDQSIPGQSPRRLPPPSKCSLSCAP